MYTLRIENPNGETIDLTGDESRYQISQITGLNPPNANIYLTAIAGMDGERYKSSHVDMRNIVITIAINGNVEQNRLRLYNFFGTGKWCKIFFKNNARNVYIEGYCEQVELNHFALKQTMQISIICPEPFFKSLSQIVIDISMVHAAFEFPFAIEAPGIEFSVIEPGREATIYNEGEVATGLIIRLTSLVDGISNPIIRNVETGNYLGVATTLNEGNVLMINTNKGKKSVQKYIGGATINAISSLMPGSTWFQLHSGLNSFVYSTDEAPENLKVEFAYNILYEGV